MTSRFAQDRRLRGAPVEPRSAGVLHRVVRVVRDGLYRPLAEDDDRVAYWVRHIRYGVLLSEICAVAVGVYALFTDSPGGRHPVLLALAAAVVVGCPLVLLLPWPAMVRDHRGPTVFYLWTAVTSAVVIVGTALDGGPSSPLDALLFLTLTYMAAAYPPVGVVAMGTLMTGAYVLVFSPHGITTSAAFFLAVMAAFTLICTMASANSWAAYDRQLLLLSTQRTLAGTDPLTGIPNRRTLVDRLTRAIEAAASGTPAVVCLVDLDGFKAVNDREGHAAGDAMLRSVASILGGVLRETDTVARLGGDEFAVLARVTESLSGELLAERLRQAVALVGAGSGVTASIGVAEVLPGETYAALLHRADSAMYLAKTDGGDRVALLPA